MAIVAMLITSAEDVPKATNLRVYTAADADGVPTVFVANRTHVYQVGDVVAVATVGTVVDGLEIRPIRIRGVESFGMGLGVVGVPVGTEVDPGTLP